MQKYPRVQNFIDDSVIYNIGVFAQTWAHIELNFWFYVFLYDPAQPNDTEKKNSIMSLRLDTQKLIEKLKKSKIKPMLRKRKY